MMAITAMTFGRRMSRCLIPAVCLLFAGTVGAQDRPSEQAADHSAHHAEPALDRAVPSASAEALRTDGKAVAPKAAEAPEPTKLLEGYGNGGFTVTTKVPEAQAFFSNGMTLGWAFAHRAAIAAMRESTRLDPECAMCLWGLAYVSGPTLNYGKDAGERVELLAMARKAQGLAIKAGTDYERAMTHALVARYRPGKVEKRDAEFAAAIAALVIRYPQDDTLGVMAADTTLVATSEESDWKPAGEKAMAFLEPVLARTPNSTPAIHFYIHAAETAVASAKAEPYADRLADLAPAASHLVHMPSHTWYWVGRYQDAADTNLRAVVIDKANAARLGHEGHAGVFDLPYHAHNVIFGLGGALMSGDSRGALSLARPLIEVAQDKDAAPPFMQLLSAAGYFGLARFDDPASVLALKEPKLPYLKAAWHYARGEAFAYQKDAAGISAEMEAIPAKIAIGEIDDDTRAPEQLLGITRAVLKGRLAVLEGRLPDAVTAFREGAAIEETEDFQRFADPPAFWYPVRRDVAATLLASGNKAGAVTEAEASLKLRPKDPVALQILAAAKE